MTLQLMPEKNGKEKLFLQVFCRTMTTSYYLKYSQTMSCDQEWENNCRYYVINVSYWPQCFRENENLMVPGKSQVLVKCLFIIWSVNGKKSNRTYSDFLISDFLCGILYAPCAGILSYNAISYDAILTNNASSSELTPNLEDNHFLINSHSKVNVFFLPILYYLWSF